MKESTKCAIALRGAVLKAIAVLGTTAFVALVASSAHAVDHNNIDANRPLSFDDAESIGLGEQSLEVGAALIKPHGRSVGGEFEVEYLYGFAPNTHLNIGLDPSVGGRTGTDDTRFDSGDVSVGLFHNFNREYDNTPAFSVLGVRASEENEGGAIVSAGIGLRQQVSYQSVLDIGLQSDIVGDDGERNDVRLVAGYSVAF